MGYGNPLHGLDSNGEQTAVDAVRTVAEAAGLLENVTPEMEEARLAARDAAGVTAEEEACLVYGDSEPLYGEPDVTTPSDEHPLADAGRERDEWPLYDRGLTEQQWEMVRNVAHWRDSEPVTLTMAQARYVLAAQQAALILRGPASLGSLSSARLLTASEVAYLADQIIEAEAEAHLTERELYPRRAELSLKPSAPPD